MIKFANVYILRGDPLQRCLSLKRGAVMVFVAKILKSPSFLLQVLKVSKKLRAIENLIEDVLKLFNSAISPGFSHRDKDNLNP